MEEYHFEMDKEQVDNLKPMNNHVVLELKDDRKMHNGILLVKMTPLIPDRGVVIKISDSMKNEEVKVGSKVVFEKYMGRKIFTKDRTYLILHEDHLFCVLPDDADVGIKYDCKL